MCIYTKAKEAFSENKFDYLKLDDSFIAYNKVLQAIEAKDKMVLLLGTAGVGKTYLLRKIANDLSQNTFFYDITFESRDEFIGQLYFDIFNKKSTLNFNDTLEVILAKGNHINLCIDEVQLYSSKILELFRVLSDTKKFTFIFSTHIADKGSLFSKQHFSSRIANSVVLHPVNFKESKIYVEKKLLFYGNFKVANMFSHSNYKLIFKLSKGNYRQMNLLLKTIFSILMRYDDNDARISKRQYISNKIIEMAMIAINQNRV